MLVLWVVTASAFTGSCAREGWLWLLGNGRTPASIGIEGLSTIRLFFGYFSVPIRIVAPIIVAPVPCQFHLSSGKLDQAAPGDRQMPHPAKAGVEWHPGKLVPCVGFIVTNLSRPAERVVAFYNQRGTAEQHIKESKNAIK